MPLKDQEQHRIPQVYWRQWAFKDKKTNAETLSVMKFGDPVTNYQKVKSFTKELNLFDSMAFKIGYERTFDTICKNVEDNYRKTVSSLQVNVYDDETRTRLAEAVSNLFVRQKNTFNFFQWAAPKRYLREKLLNEITILCDNEDERNLLKAIYEEIAIDPEDDIESKVSAIAVQAWRHFSEVFERFRHIILRAPDKMSWLTSDNPVEVLNFGYDGWIVSQRSEVYFPISKEFLVYMYISTEWSDKYLASLPENKITQVSFEVFDGIIRNILIKSHPDHLVFADDAGYYNAELEEHQAYYKAIPDWQSRYDKIPLQSLINVSSPPSLDDDDLEALLAKMNAEFDPVTLLVETHPDAVENECVAIVDSLVQTHGGKRILGWQIWKAPYLIEAEFHAVWETPEGDLKDVSFKKNGERHILFIEDPNLIYEKMQINSIRLNLSGYSLVDDFITLCNHMYRMMNKGRRAKLYGDDLDNILTTQQRQNISRVRLLRDNVLKLIDDGGNENSECFCKKGKKYKNCHGKEVPDLKRLD